MPVCWFCQANLPYRAIAAVPRDSECPSCRRDLHVCRNCRHHDPGVNNQCREPNADWISNRERANFCEYFQLAESPIVHGKPKRADEARRKLDDLFKKPE